MTSTILVVGATGNIGRELVSTLATKADLQILAGSRDPGGVADRFRHLDAVRTIELDVDDPRTIDAALAGVHKLAIVSPLHPAMGAQTRRLVDAAKRAGVHHIVRSSLMGADEPDPIAEARWHAEADAVVRDSGIPWTILRPTQYFQNFLNAGNIASVRDQDALFLPLDQCRISNIDTRDVGAVAARVLTSATGEHHGQTYVLTGGESATMAEIAEAIGEARGKPVQYVAVDPAKFRQGMLARGIPELITDAILEWFAYCRAGRADRIEGTVERLLGRRPITLRAFARDHAARYR